MPQAYSPGLLVSPGRTVRRRRILPITGEVLVAPGDHVTARQVVARTSMPGDVEPVNLSRVLGIPPRDLPQRLIRQVGDAVHPGDVVAHSPGLFGLFPKDYLAEISGTIEAVSRVTGQLLLRREPRSVDVLAYLTGTIAEVIPNEGVVVETSAAVVQGIFGIGGEGCGFLRIVTPTSLDDLTADCLTEELAGCIAVGGRRITREAVDRARELGLIALVAGGIDDHDLREILGYDLGVAITGSEALGLTIIVTEGFGEIGMAERSFRLLKSFDGREASVNGATQIRAGVVRPEIVIPLTQSEFTETELEEPVLRNGAAVRVIREPWFGELGQVTELPHEPRLLASGSLARVAGVKLQSGEMAVVPRANLELIQG